MASARVRGLFEHCLRPASSNLDLWHGFGCAERVRHGFGRCPPIQGGVFPYSHIYGHFSFWAVIDLVENYVFPTLVPRWCRPWRCRPSRRPCRPSIPKCDPIEPGKKRISTNVLRSLRKLPCNDGSQKVLKSIEFSYFSVHNLTFYLEKLDISTFLEQPVGPDDHMNFDRPKTHRKTLCF